MWSECSSSSNSRVVVMSCEAVHRGGADRGAPCVLPWRCVTGKLSWLQAHNCVFRCNAWSSCELCCHGRDYT